MRKLTIKLSLILTLAALMLSCGGAVEQEAEAKIEGYSDKEAIENIFERKSVRVYKQDKPVEQEKIELLLKAGMAAPTAMDKRPWELYVMTDKEAMVKLSEGLKYAPMLAKAPLAIVVCGDTEVSDIWYIDCSAVTQNILLAAEALDLGAVWTGVYPSQELQAVVKEQLGLPENVEALAVVPIGYPEGKFEPKQKWNEAKVHTNKW